MPELERRVSPSSHRKRWAPVRSRSWGGSRRHLRKPFAVQDMGGDISAEGVVQPILVSH